MVVYACKAPSLEAEQEEQVTSSPSRGRCWEDSSFDQVLALTAGGPALDPQSLHKQHKACCMSVTPALGKERQVDPWAQ